MKKPVKVIRTPAAPPQVQKIGIGKVQISHAIEVKLSHNYQSVACSFGMSVEVANDENSIEEGTDYVQGKINDLMTPKIKEHIEFLESLNDKS